ncbi:MAG: hypothetical protein FWH52_01615 [Synergistaceae bacterium]|nr:hypothetical protein [Synergistaceae bacterium]
MKRIKKMETMKTMKKIKCNEIMKMVTAIILSIGLFSAAFVGANNLAFAAATNKTESIPPVAKTVNIQTATINKTEYDSPAATDVAVPTAAINKTEYDPSTAADVAVPTAAINKTEIDPSTAVINKVENDLSTSATVNIPAVENTPAVENIPAVEMEPPEDYKKPEITVYQQHNEWFTPSVNALSPEEAAEIGAKYIWDVLGESIDGKTVEMYYSAHPSHTRAYWHGSVAETRENLDVTDMENYDVQFWFTICAVSGERIDISNTRRAGEASMGNEKYKALWNEIEKLSPEETVELVRLRDEYPPPERLPEYVQMAEDFAARHFNNTEVIGSRLCDYSYFGDFALDENRNIVIAPAWEIWFTVTDSAGREADIGINMNTEELLHILTQHNDIVPGYSYEGEPGVG